MILEAERAQCEECDGPLETTSREVVCADCGLVQSDLIDDSFPSVRDDEFIGNAHGPPRRYGHLMTFIGFGGSDAHGRRLTQAGTRLAYRNRRQQRRAARDTENDLPKAVIREAARLGTPTAIRDRAVALAMRARATGKFRGIPISRMALTSIFLAYRDLGFPRPLDKIVPGPRKDRCAVHRVYRRMKTALGIAVRPARGADFLPAVASQVGLDHRTRKRAADILAAVGDGARSPLGDVAAAVYAASDRKIPQAVIAHACGVSEVTLRNRLQSFEEAADGPGR